MPEYAPQQSNTYIAFVRIWDDHRHLIPAHLRMASACIRTLKTQLPEALYQLMPGDRSQSRHGYGSDGLGQLVQIDVCYNRNGQAQS